MSGFIEKVKETFSTAPSHTVPAVTHRKKVLLAVTSSAVVMPDHRSGYFWGELLHPWEVFSAKGFDCDIVSETGAATPDEFSLDKMAAAGDKKKWEDKEFPLHKKLREIHAANQVNASAYNAIFFAGGHACVDDMPRASNLQHLAAAIFEAGGTVGAVCHGPAIFDNLKLSNGQNILAGKECTGFSTKAEESSGALKWMNENGYETMQGICTRAGGKWTEHATNPMASYVKCDGRVVTGMNPASAKGVAEEMLAFLPRDADLREQAVETSALDKSRADALNEREKDRSYAGEVTH